MILFLEQAHPLAVGRGSLYDSDLARTLLGVVANERLPENSLPDRKAKKGEKSAIIIAHPLILCEKRRREEQSRLAVEARHLPTTCRSIVSYSRLTILSV